MRSRSFLAVLLAGACIAASCVGAPTASAQEGASAQEVVGVCDAAGADAERRYDVPAGLLRAIGRVESGRRDRQTGVVAPWSWTINAEGRGQSFGSREEAVATTRKLQESGVASIDVGCFQVNLVHHPQAFATLDEGFDPQRNADYAGRFLQLLRAKTGSWEAAVAAYHSSTPERGEPYRDRVLAGWSRDGGPVGAPPAGAVAVAEPHVVRMVVWTPAATPPGRAGGGPGGMRIWTPSAAGQGASVIRITRG